MQSEEQMEDLKKKLAEITKLLNQSLPELNLGNDVTEKTTFVAVNKVPYPDLKEPCVDWEPVSTPVVKEKEHPKPAPKPEPKPVQRMSLLATADEFLKDAAVYRGWLLGSIMIDGLDVTAPHVDLLVSLLSCVRELRELDKLYPNEEITFFSE